MLLSISNVNRRLPCRGCGSIVNDMTFTFFKAVIFVTFLFNNFARGCAEVHLSFVVSYFST